MPSKRDELQAQMDALKDQLADLDENDYECDVEIEGKRTTVRGKTARSWLERMGIIDKPADDTGTGDDGAGDGDQDPKPKKTGSYFS